MYMFKKNIYRIFYCRKKKSDEDEKDINSCSIDMYCCFGVFCVYLLLSF